MLVALFAIIFGAFAMIVGGWSEKNVAEIDPQVVDAAVAGVRQKQADFALDKILAAKSQVVRGYNTQMDMVGQDGKQWRVVVWFDLKDFKVTSCESLDAKEL